ncbi:MAG: RluA family pseudouridine synthase [Anaerolineae bacterium]|jgi:23S rRNA pseudouridine1911/1915/1917 synthase
MANDERIIDVRVQNPAERLDIQLAGQLTGYSRSAIQRLIKDGRVLVNGQTVKPSYLPEPGDTIRVILPPDDETSELLAQEIPLDVVYEDEHLLVIEKPAGLVVHPGAGQSDGTLVNALLARRPDVVSADLDPQRPGIVHRLDRDTSGLLVIAASRQAQADLQAQFQARTVQKIYLALVYGRLLPDEAAIEAPIGRDPVHRTRMAVVQEGGRYALTHYRVRQHLPNSTFVEADLLTGRTHQLRVHFASIGHPIVGDRVYGFRWQTIHAPRQWLHAWRLAFEHPVTGEALSFVSAIPAELQEVLDRLRQDAGRV